MVRRLQHQRWGKSWFILCHEILVRTVVYPSPQHSTRCDIWLWLTLLARGDLSTLSAGVCYQRFLLLLSFQLFQPFAALMLSCSEQQEKNKDRGKKKQLQCLDTAAPPLHGAWPTHSPHPGFVPEIPTTQLQWPEEVQKNTMSRESRKKASGFEIRSGEKCQESTMGVLWWKADEYMGKAH